MADLTVWGLVRPDGTIASGSGFRVDKVATGVYTVLFQQPFNGVPTVVASQVFPNDINSQGGDTRDNAVVIGIVNDRCRVKVGDSNGAASNRFFTFIAVGRGF